MTGRGAARGAGLSMICPAVDGFSGEVAGGYPDVRVPSWLVYGHDPHLLASWSGNCPGGRHVWDALIARGVEVDVDPDDPDEAVARRRGGSDRERAVAVQPFRLVLTCVRCGVVERLTGESWWDGRSGVTQVAPVPLRAGELLAQQVSPWGRWSLADDQEAGDWPVHSVHTGTTVVGRIIPHLGRRGSRLKHIGRLNTWPEGRSVMALTPLACLRKIARGVPAATAPATGATPGTGAMSVAGGADGPARGDGR
jgi:hypothetical protein